MNIFTSQEFILSISVKIVDALKKYLNRKLSGEKYAKKKNDRKLVPYWIKGKYKTKNDENKKDILWSQSPSFDRGHTSLKLNPVPEFQPQKKKLKIWLPLIKKYSYNTQLITEITKFQWAVNELQCEVLQAEFPSLLPKHNTRIHLIQRRVTVRNFSELKFSYRTSLHLIMNTLNSAGTAFLA